MLYLLVWIPLELAGNEEKWNLALLTANWSFDSRNVDAMFSKVNVFYDTAYVMTGAPPAVNSFATSLTHALTTAILQTLNCRWCCVQCFCVCACRRAFVYDHQDMPEK